MRRYLLLIFALMMGLSAQAQLVFADYSDPDVCEGTDGNYWLTASSFQCSPSLPLLHSTDCIHWELVGHALAQLEPRAHYDSIQHGCGVWAPSIRRHNDTYYIYWGDPDYGIFMIHTHDPRGRWSDPTLVVPGKGLIDPCPLWDDDGRVYLVNAWANSRCGFNSILTIRELSADGTHAISNPTLVYDGQVTGNHTIEGPKLYKRNGYYYILAPAGGVGQGWQMALRSKNILGPYEENRVFHHEGIHQGGLVGNHFIAFQDRGPYGRVLHLLDVKWHDGWPMMSLSQYDRPTPVSMSNPMLAYQWHANYQDHFGFFTPEGARVYGHRIGTDFRNLWQVPNLLLCKFQGETFTRQLTTVITATSQGQQSGFVVMGRDYCRLSVELVDDHFLLRYITCTDADQGGQETSVLIDSIPARHYNAGARDNYQCQVTWRIHCQQGALCQLAYSLDGNLFHEIHTPFQAREGKWIGAKYGLFSLTPEQARGWIELIP